MKRIDTITAGELIDMLGDFDPDTPVAFACNYGDRSCTQQVITIRGNVDEETIYKTAYSESGYAVDKEGCYEDEEGTSRLVIIT